MGWRGSNFGEAPEPGAACGGVRQAVFPWVSEAGQRGRQRRVRRVSCGASAAAEAAVQQRRRVATDAAAAQRRRRRRRWL